MDGAKVIKSAQEQAAAAWIDYLNQLRLNELLAKLAAQDVNLERALAELQKAKLDIDALAASGRGGAKGAHGFIAEAAEAGIENARRLIQGLTKNCQWLNDNGPADLCRDGVDIQQKFVQAGGHFGLEKIKEHLEKYPDFIKNGGKYQIPKDFYEKLQKLLSLSEEEAKKSGDYQLWKWVHEFFEKNGIDPSDIEPAALDYSQAQKGKIDETLEKEKDKIKKEDKKIREKAREDSKPTGKEGAKAAAVSAALEGGMAFCLGVARKRRAGKRLSDFTAEDWKDVGIDTAEGAAKGGIRGAAVYAMTNFTAASGAVANAFVTAAYGLVGQACQLRRGDIAEEDFIVNSEAICLEVTVSAVSSLLGQTLIPVPVLGAIIGNVAGMFMYQIAKDDLSERERALIAGYREDMERLDRAIEGRYRALAARLKAELAEYSSLLELAFDRDVNVAFDGSIALAGHVGVESGKILRGKREIDRYFLE